MPTRLYNPWNIENTGEREADKQLSSDAGDELMLVFHGLRISSRFHKVQMAGECDFVLLTRHGIMVMEVKGGIIGYGKADNGSHGYYRFEKDNAKTAIKNPFIQSYGNADALRNLLSSKGISDVFIGSMACFPECDFSFDVPSGGFLWHRGAKISLTKTISEFLEEQISRFIKKELAKGIKQPKEWKTLDKDQLDRIAEIIKPEFDPGQMLGKLKLNLKESDLRRRQGIEILHGLDMNRRLIVQGPSGSGKSTYALDIIYRLGSVRSQKGLYICWNELLAAEIRSVIASDANKNLSDNIKVIPFFDLAVELADSAGDKALIPTYEKADRGEIKQLVNAALKTLRKNKMLPAYDFIIIDEAQDLFDKGIDLVIKFLLKGNNPIENGSYYIFYDDSQAFPESGDLEPYIRTRDMFMSIAASYNLFSNLRVNTGHGIIELIRDAEFGLFDPGKKYGEDVMIRQWKDHEEAISLLKQFYHQEKVYDSWTQFSKIALFSANLLKEGSPMPEILGSDPDFELLQPRNWPATGKKIQYTTMLKAKGLEWDVVFLVCTAPVIRKDYFQLFIGASRAKVKVFLLVGEE